MPQDAKQEQPLAEPAILNIQAGGANYMFVMPSMQALKDKSREILTQGFVEVEQANVYLFLTRDGIAFVGMPQSVYAAQQAEVLKQQQAAQKPAQKPSKLVY